MKIHLVTSMAENEGRSQRAQAKSTLSSSRATSGGGRAKQVTFFVGNKDDSAIKTMDASLSMAPQDRVSAFDQTLPASEQEAIIDTALQLHRIQGFDKSRLFSLHNL